MTKAKRLVAPIVPVDLPPCDALRKSPYANDKPDTDRRCKWSAKYRIGNRNLCTKHAGPAALAVLLGEKT